MFGTREELCVQLENMFTLDEPLVLLVWTEEGVAVACNDHDLQPDEKEIWALMKAMGEKTMTEYRREGITNAGVSELLTNHREAANRQVNVPVGVLSRVLQDYERELETRAGQAWDAGRPEPERVHERLNDVRLLRESLAA